MKLTKIKKEISKLRLFLMANLITQSELSKRLGIDPSKVSWICNGRMVLTDEEKQTVAEALDTTVDTIF